MRTEKQQQASRENGARSNGPVTAEGKANAAKNSTKHGLTAKCPILLTVEDQQAYAAMHEEYVELFKPKTILHRQLVDEMTSIQWRRQRAEALEAATIDFAMDRMAASISVTMPGVDNTTRVALAYNHEVNESKTLANLQRISERLSRQFQRTLKTYRDLLDNPIEPEPEPVPEPEAAPEPQPESEPETAPETTETESDKTNPGKGEVHGIQNDGNGGIPAENSLDQRQNPGAAMHPERGTQGGGQ